MTSIFITWGGNNASVDFTLFFFLPNLKVNDDRTILDKTVGDQVSLWKSSRGLTDNLVIDHACSGETCSYYQIGDVFVCEKTGNVHGMIHVNFLIW